jgi:pimeloyl-ACP methyl ester carboxylesterase
VSTFVLVHGAWHGAWAWNRVVKKLKNLGHEVIALDLPGHGWDKTPVQQVTLQSYVERVVETLDRLTPLIVLAGHSMGGIVISQTAEQRPDRIGALVYVCAFLLKDGQALVDVSGADVDALVMPNLILAKDGASATLRPEVVREAFYADCSDADSKFATSQLVAQATAPLGTPLQLSNENFGRVPRFYVECTQDRAITLNCQREMQSQTCCDGVFTLHCSHSPFFSAVDELVDCLLTAAGVLQTKTSVPRAAASD